jgi:hypothetical protein
MQAKRHRAIEKACGQSNERARRDRALTDPSFRLLALPWPETGVLQRSGWLMPNVIIWTSGSQRITPMEQVVDAERRRLDVGVVHRELVNREG